MGSFVHTFCFGFVFLFCGCCSCAKMAAPPILPPRGPPGTRRSRVAHLLSTYYDMGGDAGQDSSKTDPTNIDGINFDADAHYARLLRERHLQNLVRESRDLSDEIKTLEGDLQMLVYENYNKFISATDTIRKMKDNVSCIEGELGKLSGYMEDINGSSDAINNNLSDSRAKIEQLNAVRGLVKKLQFVFELPSKLNRSVSCEAYTQAVTYYTMASQILDQNSNIPTFRSIKDEADDIMHRLRAQMRELVRRNDIDSSVLTELVGLLLKLDEDDLSLRNLFVSRWMRDITAKIEQMSQAHPGDLMTHVRQVHEAAVKNTVRFASDFSTLFLDPKVLDEKSINKARTQLDTNVMKLIAAYLALLHKLLDSGTVTGSVVMEVLQQVELNTRGLLATVPHLDDLRTKYLEFANQALVREIRKCTKPAESRFQQAIDNIRRCSIEVHMHRAQSTHLSPSLSSSGSSSASNFYSLVLSSASNVQDAVKLLHDELQLITESAGADVHLLDMTSRLMAEEVLAMHSRVHTSFLNIGALNDLHPNFGYQNKDPQPLAQHPVAVLLAASLCRSLLDKAVWTPLVDFISGSQKKRTNERQAQSPFNSTMVQITWSNTSQRLLNVYVRWTSQLCVTTFMGDASWASCAATPEHISTAIVNVINAWWRTYGDVIGAFNIQRELPKEESIKISNDDSRLCSARGKGVLIEKDIARMFSREKTSGAMLSLELNPNTTLLHVIQAATKALVELIRQEPSLELFGLHQVQVDVRCVRLCVALLVDSPASVDALLDDVLMGAADRCLEPSPAENMVVDGCLAKSRTEIQLLHK
eukprot:c2040_g1_i1.p1 GENE.c2040_g1_i1~~c2040_g1_i1.p1  ORF type:complete len:815 (+),score=215.59 c2040_g1_i1:3-2447(+)